MYERFFNLTETPFSIAPNPHYLYMSQQHNEALAHLVYGVGRDGGFVLLTGEVGTGKTTVCRCFLEQVPKDTDVAFVLNPKLEVDELLATICDELSIPYIGDSISVKDYVDCINGYLLKQHSQGRHTVLIIDEAQNLSSDVLEQIRLLTNLETHEKKLLQIVLLGQPELQDMFKQPELRQLSQRVTARFHLSALTEQEIAPYVYHRLSVAGAVDPKSMFPEKSLRKLFQISKGIPRVINLVCDRAMLGAYAKETRVVDTAIISSAAKEVLGYDVVSPLGTNKKNLISISVAAGFGATVVLLLGVLLFGWKNTHTVDSGTIAQSEASQSTNTIAPLDKTSGPKESKPLSAQTLSTQTLSVNTITELPPPASLIQNGAAHAKPEFTEPKPLAPQYLGIEQAFEISSYGSEAQAYIDLFAAWGANYDPENDGFACRFAETKGLACLSKLGSLGSVKHYGLPVILKLFDRTGAERFIVVRSMAESADNTASIYINGKQETVNIADLDQYWRGHYSLLWKKPPAYHGPMHPGTIAPLSKWIAYQLDVWEQKPVPAFGRSTYDSDLVERVKAFQRDVGESDDGVVGTGTLIQLSRRVDDSVPRLSSSLSATGGGS